MTTTTAKDSQNSSKKPEVKFTSDESVEQILNESQKEFLLTQNEPVDSSVENTVTESTEEPQILKRFVFLEKHGNVMFSIK